ncbi:phosphomevalonate kinase [Nocardia terpenica]|uniref:phosphomevalonate kinase n=1 Tax=Nocardia terpenica TaxID=455432 RepID=A0A6G9ZCW8_9NOCA|nr:phosphomevalonate kinase [Nocardia terpenica]QIS23455.1 phosphomevalonate kinase [Nocardia terpenica]
MITCRAPGKLFLAGEYAVLAPGHPGVLVAVDRYATVTVAETRCETITLASDLGGGTRIRCDRDRDGPIVVSGSAAGRFGYVLAAVTVVERLLLERGGRPRWFALTVTGGDLTDGFGHKLGLGSSAAVTVATVAALGAFYDLSLTPADRYRLAMLATLAVAPQGSGGDVAAATWGGWIAYRSPEGHRVAALAAERGVDAALRARWPGLSVRLLPTPARSGLLVGWTGQPSSTPALTARLGNRHQRIREHPAFLADSTICVEHLTAALGADDVAVVQHDIRRARRILDNLDAATGLGIRTPRLDALCTAAEAAGAAAKPSGAGGGDCGIAIIDRDNPAQASDVTHRWIEAGIQPVPCHIHPHDAGHEGDAP